MRVCGLEFTSDTIKLIQQTQEDTPALSRRGLATCICQWMNWKSVSGRFKETICRKALSVLEEMGIISLPVSDRPRSLSAGPLTKTAKDDPISGCSAKQPGALTAISCDLSELGRIELRLIKSRFSKEAKIWKSLMDQYHYLGKGPLCGAQLRYLIHSPVHGYLGGLSFSSAAWSLKERDNFIGWTESARRSHLQQVVCNSRFLIIPTVKVKNLASHVLGQSAGLIVNDWKSRYGVEPVVLETFVDQERFNGTSYRAANWLQVGKTSGRRGRKRGNGGGPKTIYLYPLCSDWKRIVCAEPVQVLGQRPRPVAPADWVEEEFSTVELHDPRLTRRLFHLARDFASQSQALIPQVCGSLAQAKAAYRFFNNKRVSMDKLLRAHKESALERIKGNAVVLAVQDTSTLNYATHRAMEGTGPIGTSKDTAFGLILHDTMAFTTEGTPLGLLDVQCWARDRVDRGKRDRRKELPIEQKESMKWLTSYRAVAEVQRACPDTMLVCVSDRESDVYELFLEACKEQRGPRLLVRCERTRNRKSGEQLLWEMVENQPVAGIHGVHLPRRDCQLARDAKLEIRYTLATLTPPKDSGFPPVDAWMVHAREIDAPRSVKSPLEWMLLTTVQVNTLEEACERLAWYAKRWGIEVYHRTLKSGCKIEDRRLESADSFKSCLALDMVVAWRVHHLTMLSRWMPNAPCSVFFEEAEWKALYLFINKNLEFPEPAPPLRTVTRMVGSLGGFLGRKSDGEPGVTVLWRGLQRLEDITATFVALRPLIRAGP